jgi:hypothetical protein
VQIERPDTPLPARAKSPETTEQDASGCFIRVLWLASNVALLVIAALIARDGAGVLSIASGVFWATVALASGLHYLEVKRLDGATLAGKPATVGSWRRYSLRLVAIAAAMWTLALVLG